MPQKIKCETKAIIPEQWDVEAIIRAVPEALKQSTREMLADFNSTAATWDHKPAFSVISTKDSAEVSTTDENWIRIDRVFLPKVQSLPDAGRAVVVSSE